MSSRLRAFYFNFFILVAQDCQSSRAQIHWTTMFRRALGSSSSRFCDLILLTIRAYKKFHVA